MNRPVSDKIDSGAIEYFIQGKGGATPKGSAACEDGLFYNDHFIALYDGATDKSGKSYNGKKGGRIAEEIIENVFKGLPPEASKEETLARINRSYQDFYKAHPEMDFVKNTTWRPTAHADLVQLRAPRAGGDRRLQGPYRRREYQQEKQTGR